MSRETAEIRIVGLPNLGNTCYANSILQILSSISTIVLPKSLYVKEGLSQDEYALASNIFRLMGEIREGKPDKKTLIQVFVSVAKRYPQFSTGQHDQNEYLNSILEILHNCSSAATDMIIEKPGRELSYSEKLELGSLDDLRRNGSGIVGTGYSATSLKDNRTLMNSTIFHNFTGQLITRIECVNPECGYISDTFDVFKTWEVPIKKGCHTLDDCLSKFVQITKLDEDDTNECKKCKVKTRSHVRRQLWRAPKVLVISLKRFVAQNIGGQWHMTKINNPIGIPDVLDILNYEIIPSSAARNQISKYRLKAIAHHMGEIGFGHCYSHIKKNGNWYHVDDDAVQQVDGPSCRNAYMVFYERDNPSS